MTYTEKDLQDKEFVLKELSALIDLKNELLEKISSYNSSLSVPESLYGQLDSLYEQISELKEALGDIEEK